MALVLCILLLEVFFVVRAATCTDLTSSDTCAGEAGCYWKETSSGSCDYPQDSSCTPSSCSSESCNHVVASCEASAEIECGSKTDPDECAGAGCAWEVPTKGKCFNAQCSFQTPVPEGGGDSISSGGGGHYSPGDVCQDEKKNSDACTASDACIPDILGDAGCAGAAEELGSCQGVNAYFGNQCVQSGSECKGNPNFAPPACSGAANEDACDDIGPSCTYDYFCVRKSGTCASGSVEAAGCTATNGCTFIVDAPFCKPSGDVADCSGISDVSEDGCPNENAACEFVEESCEVKTPSNCGSPGSPCSDFQISSGCVSTPSAGVCAAVNTNGPSSRSLIGYAPLFMLLMVLSFML